MSKRLRSHIIETKSRLRLHEIFGDLGWIVWDLTPDYGEDLLVRIVINNATTHYSFFVQAKSTDHIDRYRDREGKYISYPIDVEHLQDWKHFWEPVILTVYDTQSGITYWEIIQDYLQSNEIPVSRKSLRVSIPVTRVLDDKGLESIFRRTKLRFQRFELTCDGANALKSCLERNLNVKVVYEPGDDIIEVAYYKDSGEREHIDFILIPSEDEVLDLSGWLTKAAQMTKVMPQQLFKHTVDGFVNDQMGESTSNSS